MGYYFCLKCKDEDGEMRYIDVAGAHCKDGVEVEPSKDFHGGETQMWMWDGSRIVSSIGLPNFSLAVRELRHNAPIILRFREFESIGESYNVHWTFQDGTITVEDNTTFYIGLREDAIVLLRMDEDEVPTTWETQVIITDHLYKKAMTGSLHYEPPQHMPIIECWTIENTVCVRKSADYTYFCVIQFVPGGHAGLKQYGEESRVVEFTFFNDGFHTVTTLKHGEGVEVSEVGNDNVEIDDVANKEGNTECIRKGMKAVKEVNWMPYQEVSIKITAEKQYKGFGTQPIWRCTCWYSVGGSHVWEYMVTYERGGGIPFNHQLSSYIEDFTGDVTCESHCLQRSAEFSETKLILGEDTEKKKESKKKKQIYDQVFDYRECTFSKEVTEEESFTEYKCFGAVKKSPLCFVLSTGGQTGTDIFATLTQTGCQQRTNENFTKLFMQYF